MSQKGPTPTGASQIRSASPATPPVISASDPFFALSQTVKDGSSLVITLSIPNSTTREPDVNLSSNEGSKEVLEDSKDEPVMKNRVYDSDEDDGDERKTEVMGICLLPLSDLLFFLFFFFLFFFFF